MSFLEELREKMQNARPDPERLVRSIHQSMRVEGVNVAEETVRAAVRRVLGFERAQ